MNPRSKEGKGSRPNRIEPRQLVSPLKPKFSFTVVSSSPSAVTCRHGFTVVISSRPGDASK